MPKIKHVSQRPATEEEIVLPPMKVRHVTVTFGFSKPDNTSPTYYIKGRGLNLKDALKDMLLQKRNNFKPSPEIKNVVQAEVNMLVLERIN